MTLIEAVRQYLLTCPLLTEGRLNVDFLPPETTGYSVDVVPTKEIVRRYMDGSSVRQFLFVLATRTYYGEFIRQQIDNLGFFEDFSVWLEKQNRVRRLPDLGNGRKALRLEVLTSGYAFAPGAETARYQIQCKLTYFQKGVNR